jgi:hypothetical protein
MTTGISPTKQFIMALVLLAGIYDVAAIAFGLPTISRYFYESSSNPTIPACMGVAFGHLFFVVTNQPVLERILVACSGAVIGFGLGYWI